MPSPDDPSAACPDAPAAQPAGAHPDPGAPGAARAALVTGGARRLGRAIALGLASAGWDVAVHYGRSAEEAARTVEDIRALGRRAAALGADLADAAQVAALVGRAAAAVGPLSCVVNSASRFEFDRPESFEAASLAAHMAPNLAAPLALARALHDALGPPAGAPRSPGDPRGVVINLLDQKLAHPNPDFFSYTLTKVALEAATRMSARALAPRLRVVGVSPGITLPSAHQSLDNFARAHRIAPLGRSSDPQDIVAAVVFLAEARAITGVNLAVDGGQHLLGMERDVMYLAQ